MTADTCCIYCGTTVIESWATDDEGGYVLVHADTGDDACEPGSDYSAHRMHR